MPQLFKIPLTAVSSFQYLIAECVHYSRHGGCTVAVTEAAAQMHDPGGPAQMGFQILSVRCVCVTEDRSKEFMEERPTF